MSYQSRSTNPYIMEKKLNECVGGGGFDPSVLEEIEAEISVLGSENATMAQDIIDIKGSLNSINDNLTIEEYTSSAQTLALAIDDYINNSDLANNKSCMIKLITNLGNYQVEIFRAGTYSGFIQRLSSTEYGERYTFVKVGGASTVISPF